MAESQFSDAVNKAKQNPNFCLYPFTHIATKTDGSLKLCCRSEVVGSIQETGIDQHWNGEKIRTIRKQFLSGEQPKECKTCWRSESYGTRSMRQRSMASTNAMSRWNLYHSVLEQYDSASGHLYASPKTIEIKTSNICNLKCRMCHPVDSSAWAKDWPAIAHLMKENNGWPYRKVQEFNLGKKPILSAFENKSWFPQLKALAQDLETIEFAGGEPLLDPSHHRLLEELQEYAPNISLKYSTNLTTLKAGSRDIIELWRPFKKINIYISMDGVNQTYDYIRTNGKFEDILKNLHILKAAKINLGELAVACTVQIYNIFNISDIADFCMANEILFHLHYVTNPKFLNVQILPSEIKADVLNDLRTHYDRIENEHIRRHFKDLINYISTDRNSHLIKEFLEYTDILDQLRNTRFSDIHPKAALYLNVLREKMARSLLADAHPSPV